MNNKLFIHKSLPEMYHIEVDKQNKIYVEVSGKKDGIPVFLFMEDQVDTVEVSIILYLIQIYLDQ